MGSGQEPVDRMPGQRGATVAGSEITADGLDPLRYLRLKCVNLSSQTDRTFQEDLMADEKETCKNPVCGCVPRDGKYCSASCEGTGDTIEIDCDCGHPECTGNF